MSPCFASFLGEKNEGNHLAVVEPGDAMFVFDISSHFLKAFGFQ